MELCFVQASTVSLMMSVLELCLPPMQNAFHKV